MNHSWGDEKHLDFLDVGNRLHLVSRELILNRANLNEFEDIIVKDVSLRSSNTRL